MGGLVILGFAAMVGLMIIYATIRSGSYRPSPPPPHVSDPESGPFWCQIHKYYFRGISTTCPRCDADYEADIRDGVYPPGINESNKKFYWQNDWKVLRKIELRRDQGEITEQQAIAEQDRYIREVVLKRIKEEKGPEQRATEAEKQKMSKRLNYAGAAQYSGITPK